MKKILFYVFLLFGMVSFSWAGKFNFYKAQKEIQNAKGEIQEEILWNAIESSAEDSLFIPLKVFLEQYFQKGYLKYEDQAKLFQLENEIALYRRYTYRSDIDTANLSFEQRNRYRYISATALWNEVEFEKAREMLSLIDSNSMDYNWGLLLHATIEFRNDKWDSGMKFLEMIVEKRDSLLNKNSSLLYFASMRLAQVLYEKKEYQKSIDILQTIPDTFFYYDEVRYTLVMSSLKQKRISAQSKIPENEPPLLLLRQYRLLTESILLMKMAKWHPSFEILTKLDDWLYDYAPEELKTLDTCRVIIDSLLINGVHKITETLTQESSRRKNKQQILEIQDSIFDIGRRMMEVSYIQIHKYGVNQLASDACYVLGNKCRKDREKRVEQERLRNIRDQQKEEIAQQEIEELKRQLERLEKSDSN